MKNKNTNPYDTPNTRKILGDFYVETMSFLLGYRKDMPILKFDFVPKPKVIKQNNNKK